MSNSLTLLEQTDFDSYVKVIYQSLGNITRGTVRERTGVTGGTESFRKVGSVVANPLGYGAQVQPQDPNFAPVNVSLVKYSAACSTDRIQDLTVNFDVKTELATVLGLAIRRRYDQININALDASGTSFSIGDGGENLTYAKITQAAQFLDNQGVPPEDRHLLISASGQNSLLQDDHFTSWFFTNNNVVKDGMLNTKTALGFTIHVIPAMAEGGLPLAGDIRTCFAYHKLSMGMAIGEDFRTMANYIPQNDSFLINTTFFAGSVAVDNTGVVEIDCDESV